MIAELVRLADPDATRTLKYISARALHAGWMLVPRGRRYSNLIGLFHDDEGEGQAAQMSYFFVRVFRYPESRLGKKHDHGAAPR